MTVKKRFEPTEKRIFCTLSNAKQIKYYCIRPRAKRDFKGSPGKDY